MLVRKVLIEDLPTLTELYKEVAQVSGGIARTQNEISDVFVEDLYYHTFHHGLMLVCVDPDTKELLGEIHASKYGLHIFDHILTSLTIIVKPRFQGKGIGKYLFTRFLQEVDVNWPDIKRIELESRSSNEKSISLYKSLGFIQEGRMINKTCNMDGSYEDSLLFARLKPSF